MILDLNKKLTIFLMLFFVSCSKDEVINNVEEDVHDQLSTNVEITLTKKGNITAKIKSEILQHLGNSKVFSGFSLDFDRLIHLINFLLLK